MSHSSAAHHPIGHESLDRALGGGLPVGKLSLFHGEPGVGKTVLALAYLATGLRAGQTVAMVTAEPAADVLDQARALGFSFDRPLRQGQLAIAEYDAHVRERIPLEHGYRTVLADLADVLPAGKLERLVIDPFTPLVNLENRFRIAGATVEISRALRERAGDEGSVMVIGETAETEGERALLAELRRQAYGTFRVEAGRSRGGLVTRRIIVEKTRWCEVAEPVLAFSIEQGVGVVDPAGGAPPGREAPGA